jgi:hypothetical protein
MKKVGNMKLYSFEELLDEDEMGAWMAEKGGWSAENRVQIVVFEG